jgi:hypothetical protein
MSTERKTTNKKNDKPAKPAAQPPPGETGTTVEQKKQPTPEEPKSPKNNNQTLGTLQPRRSPEGFGEKVVRRNTVARRTTNGRIYIVKLGFGLKDGEGG